MRETEKDATCTEGGHNEYEYCTMCDHAIERVDIAPTGHNYQGVTCTYCGDTLSESEGLEYKLVEVEDGENYYVVAGLGECTEEYVVIPSEFENAAVKGIAGNAFKDSGIKGVIIPIA